MGNPCAHGFCRRFRLEAFASMLLLSAAVLFTLRTRAVQFRRFRGSFRAFFSASGRTDGVSPYQASATSLAATIGTGNIAGTAGAILLGGEGAVFWMWISALFGMAAKYLEIYFAIRFAPKEAGAHGSPMQYIERGLGQKFRPLAIIYALFCLLAALTMGNCVQMVTLCEGVVSLFSVWNPSLSERGLLLVSVGAALCSALIVLPVLLGGAKRTGQVTAALVPVMSAFYILFALALILWRIDRLPNALYRIFYGAFHPRALLGGAAGIGIQKTFALGISRGVFTHESGVGTAALAHGSVKGADKHRQALYGIFEVFLDTIVLCTLTALAILVSGVALDYGNANQNGALVINAFAVLLGSRAASAFIAISLVLFALSSIISFSLYGRICADYLLGKRSRAVYIAAFTLLCAASSVLPIARVWQAGEWMNCLAGVVNAVAMLLLSRRSSFS